MRTHGQTVYGAVMIRCCDGCRGFPVARPFLVHSACTKYYVVHTGVFYGVQRIFNYSVRSTVHWLSIEWLSGGRPE